MLSLVSKALSLYRNRGPFALVRHGLKYGYEKIVRTHLPRRCGTFNDVKVNNAHLGDGIVPWETKNDSAYESAIVEALHQQVEEGDTVVIVGGGWGVSSVVAANLVRQGGSVIIYEASIRAVEQVTETAKLNGVRDIIEVRHNIVSDDISTMGETGDVSVLSPSELPDCDVLVLDCEGAEQMILDEMVGSPRCAIVETHGHLGAPRSDIEEKLQDRGYTITESAVAESGKRDFCVENGIYVLTAVRNYD